MERKLFTALQGEQAEDLNDTLSKQGFRRSQNVLYRPSCSDCSACLSARIRVGDFNLSKNQRRVEKKNAHLTRRARAPWATEEQYDLFRRYLDDRHADGGMADMDVFEFAAMIEETPIKTRVIEYSTQVDERANRRQLAAVCLTDVLDDGLSMVYSFFDPALRAESLGTFVILDHIRLAQEAGLPYVYLGYWVADSPKMDYKSRFSPLEIYVGGHWTELADPDAFRAAPHPLSNDPIAQQVAQITLPGVKPVRG